MADEKIDKHSLFEQLTQPQQDLNVLLQAAFNRENDVTVQTPASLQELLDKYKQSTYFDGNEPTMHYYAHQDQLNRTQAILDKLTEANPNPHHRVDEYLTSESFPQTLEAAAKIKRLMKQSGIRYDKDITARLRIGEKIQPLAIMILNGQMVMNFSYPQDNKDLHPPQIIDQLKIALADYEPNISVLYQKESTVLQKSDGVSYDSTYGCATLHIAMPKLIDKQYEMTTVLTTSKALEKLRIEREHFLDNEHGQNFIKQKQKELLANMPGAYEKAEQATFDFFDRYARNAADDIEDYKEDSYWQGVWGRSHLTYAALIQQLIAPHLQNPDEKITLSSQQDGSIEIPTLKAETNIPELLDRITLLEPYIVKGNTGSILSKHGEFSVIPQENGTKISITHLGFNLGAFIEDMDDYIEHKTVPENITLSIADKAVDQQGYITLKRPAKQQKNGLFGELTVNVREHSLSVEDAAKLMNTYNHLSPSKKVKFIASPEHNHLMLFVPNPEGWQHTHQTFIQNLQETLEEGATLNLYDKKQIGQANEFALKAKQQIAYEANHQHLQTLQPQLHSLTLMAHAGYELPSDLAQYITEYDRDDDILTVNSGDVSLDKVIRHMHSFGVSEQTVEEMLSTITEEKYKELQSNCEAKYAALQNIKESLRDITPTLLAQKPPLRPHDIDDLFLYDAISEEFVNTGNPELDALLEPFVYNDENRIRTSPLTTQELADVIVNQQNIMEAENTKKMIQAKPKPDEPTIIKEEKGQAPKGGLDLSELGEKGWF